MTTHKLGALTTRDENSVGALSPSIDRLAAEARGWLLDDAAPLWSTVGRTPIGLFAERLNRDGSVDPAPFRTFVQARHIFSFVEIGKMGWNGPWRSLVIETAEALVAHARRADGLFVHSLNASGTVHDGRWDLYDQAFVLLAFAKAAEASSDEAWIDESERLLSTLETKSGRGDGSFHEGEIVDPSIRRQNPHMHLFESLLALSEISGRQRFEDRALAVAGLCKDHLLDPRTGALLEYFDDDWSPVAGLAGETVEPGHCFEWAWLFERLARHGVDRAVSISDRLCDFARSHGLAHDGRIAINEVTLDGMTIDGVARLWPQTERLKAAVARYRRLGSDEEGAEIVNAADGLKFYLNPEVKGTWRDKLRDDGRWIDEFVPGSSLYHISCAYSELVATAESEN